MTSVRLAAAGDAGDAGEERRAGSRRDVLQVVRARADDGERLAVAGLRRCFGIGIWRTPDRYCAGEAVGAGHDLVGRALRDDLAAVDAGAGADVDHVVGGADRVLVVLDHDHRVADVAQVLERLEQPRVVALVQADRRLVQHVEHAGQAGADLRGQADALALAARQRAGGARQRQIVEADVVQELQALADLLEDARGDLGLLLGEASSAARRTRRWPRGSTGRVTSPMCLPPIFTASAWGLRR